MIGAILVASEVVNKFNDKKYENIIIDNPTPQELKESEVLVKLNGTPIHVTRKEPKETENYIKWQEKTYFKMKLGLGFLLLGFLIQILSNTITYISI